MTFDSLFLKNRYKRLNSIIRRLEGYISCTDWFQFLLIKGFSMRRKTIPFAILDRIGLLRRYKDNPIRAHRFMNAANFRNPMNTRMLDMKLLRSAVEFNYLSWPRRIFTYVRDKDLLDVGCGTGLHAIGYVVAGVNSYTGLDPKIDFSNDRGKNLRTRQWEQFGWTPSEIMQQLPHVRFIPGTFEEIAPEVTYDIVVLHNVTEYLHNLEAVFKGIVNRLRPNGKILYNGLSIQFLKLLDHLKSLMSDQIKAMIEGYCGADSFVEFLALLGREKASCRAAG